MGFPIWGSYLKFYKAIPKKNYFGAVGSSCVLAAGRCRCPTLLGGSWVVISGGISRITIVLSPIRGLITLLITTHEPPSNPLPSSLTIYRPTADGAGNGSVKNCSTSAFSDSVYLDPNVSKIMAESL